MAVYDENLMRQLRSCNAGAAVHTRNKALCYYQWLKLDPELRKELEVLIRKALKTDDWSALKHYMRRWF